MALTVRIKGDASHLERVLAKTKASLSGVGSILKGTGIGVLALGAAATATAAGLATMYAKMAVVGEQAIADDKRLENITKQMGLFGNQTSKVTERLLNFADAQERSTGADTVVATQAKLMTFKELAKTADVVGGSFDRATMAAIDMAAAGFGSAEQNAVQLGKALNDPIKGINSLTRSGITFTLKEKEKIAALVQSGNILKAQGIILKAIETQVGGTAEATASSTGKLRQSYQQLLEEFAKPFALSLTGLPGQIEEAFPMLKEKAGMAGSIISRAIQDGIRGDFDRLAELAMIGGRVIAEGIKIGLKGALVGVGESSMKFMEDINPIRMIPGVGNAAKGSEYISQNKDEYLRSSMQDAVDAIMASIRDKYAPVGVSPSAQRLYDQGSRSDSPGMTEDMRRMLRVLEDINRKTSPITY